VQPIISGRTKLLVASDSKIVEVVNLDQSNPNLICNNLPDLPVALSHTAGGLFQGTTPILCGNQHGGSQCFSLENNSWKSASRMAEFREYYASFFSNKKDESYGLMIVGGSNKGSKSLQTVASFNGTYWDEGKYAILPIPLRMNCMVQINSSVLMSIGGDTDNSYSGLTGQLL
jgi:hypothetical protein